jgi:hypothetical protein
MHHGFLISVGLVCVLHRRGFQSLMIWDSGRSLEGDQSQGSSKVAVEDVTIPGLV